MARMHVTVSLLTVKHFKFDNVSSNSPILHSLSREHPYFDRHGTMDWLGKTHGSAHGTCHSPEPPSSVARNPRSPWALGHNFSGGAAPPAAPPLRRLSSSGSSAKPPALRTAGLHYAGPPPPPNKPTSPTAEERTLPQRRCCTGRRATNRVTATRFQGPAHHCRPTADGRQSAVSGATDADVEGIPVPAVPCRTLSPG